MAFGVLSCHAQGLRRDAALAGRALFPVAVAAPHWTRL